jgi:hypothetical protein
MFNAYQQAGGFPADVESSVATLNRLRLNASVLNQISWRHVLPHSSAIARVENTRTNPIELGRWSFMYRNGMTTATYVLQNTKVASERVRIVHNGTQVADVAMTGGIQTITVTLSGLSDQQIVEVRITIIDLTMPSDLEDPDAWGRYDVLNAYAGPLSACMVDTYGGVPTFTTGPAPALLQQLADAQHWIWRRLAFVPMPHWIGTVLGAGTWWSGTTTPMWIGSVTRSTDHREFRLPWRAERGTATSERFRLRLNGVQVTEATIAAGATSGTLVADLSSYASGTTLLAELQQVILTGDEFPNGGATSTRWDLLDMRLAAPSPSLASLPTALTTLQSMTWTQLRDWLNAVATATQATYTRIQDNPVLFDRAPMFRRAYGFDDFQREYFSSRYISYQRRGGLVLVVRGKNLTLAWGPTTIERPEDGEPIVENAYTEQLVSGDSVQTKVIYLSTYGAIPPGAYYTIRGSELTYAAEFHAL